jgi:hypothetical protein
MDKEIDFYNYLIFKNYDKNYRIENKDKIKAREKLKAKCPICDLEMTKHCIKRHII